ncbi:MAG: glycerol-3-phosphate dehydrogenase [Xanthobacteraceae bacterium]
MADFDLAVIGAGVVGTAVARDAAGRGISVLLLGRGDLASGASFGAHMLVRNTLDRCHRIGPRAWYATLHERAIIHATAPHLARAIGMVLPPQDCGRAPLSLRARLFACDHLARQWLLPRSRTVDLTHHPFGIALRRHFEYGFVYSDCLLDEARLSIANARDAANRGAVVRLHTSCRRAERGSEWGLVLHERGEREVVTARALVNAADAAVTDVAATIVPPPAPLAMRFVRKSYIIAPRVFNHEGGYLLPDRQRGGYVLALPYTNDTMLIGPAEQELSGNVTPPTVSAAEIAALCGCANHYFRQPVHPDNVTPYACVRVMPGRAWWRRPDHVIRFDHRPGGAPLMTICGGSPIMTRRIAEAAMDRLTRFFRAGPAWTAHVALPGGDFAADGFDALVAETVQHWPFLDTARARRLVASYGTRVSRILGEASAAADLGEVFGDGLTAAEVRYLMREEWAETADDILTRRSRLVFTMQAHSRNALARFVAAEHAAGRP